ncbi:MAG: hypothetical protein BWK76_02090 [Desulfobulbaceae bacterium A2]|nr:MAG: hypothetical protein BWK76_02090 [Desulfobulbaceae bacterium A2]
MTRKNILLVDCDKAFLRQMREEFLSYSDNYQVAFASSTAKAEEILDKFRVHLVVANIYLAGESGIALLPLIRRRHGSTRVVLYGDSLTAEARRAALYGGALAILKQPLVLQDLLELLSSVFPEDSRGTLTDVVQLGDLLQLFSLGKHCTDIKVINADLQEGIIRIRHGKLMYAEAEGKQGVAALAEMLSWPSPTLETEKCDSVAPPSASKSLEQVLMQAFIMLDEH